jgi:hypothetical protein
MIISGEGISTPFTLKVLSNFKPRTKLALSWVRVSNGNHCAVDRGAEGDIYEADIALAGVENTVQNFLAQIELNRQHADGHILTLSSFNDGEKIFGADVDYTSSIDATIIKLNRKIQKTWKSFSLSLTLRALAPAFTGTASLPTLKPLVGYDGDTSFDVDKFDSYYGDFFYSDNDRDSGTFTATYHFTMSDMRAIRRYLTTERGNSIWITSLTGVTKPFGRASSVFPVLVKIIDWDDLGLNAWGVSSSVRCCTLRMTMAKVV